jgi:GTP pyrophosphokinase
MFYKGDKSLPKNNFSGLLTLVHSEIGIKTRGTRVTGSVPLNYELKNGDQVEIITSQNQNLPLTGLITLHIQSKK